jgi:putative transcriptional regulator
MKTKTKKHGAVTEAILEMAGDMHRVGIMNDTDFDKITMRHVGKENTATAEPLSGKEIRTMRERSHMSQAVFARHLNVTTGYVSQLERGAKRPTGAALVLLNVIRRKGIETIL